MYISQAGVVSDGSNGVGDCGAEESHNSKHATWADVEQVLVVFGHSFSDEIDTASFRGDVYDLQFVARKDVRVTVDVLSGQVSSWDQFKTLVPAGEGAIVRVWDQVEKIESFTSLLINGML